MGKEIEVILREIDIITAVLLFTGQIYIGGVFLQTNSAFGLSLSGPITGGSPIVSKPKSPLVDASIDIIDITTAILLITDKINVIGTFINSGRFTIVVGGPLFGGEKREVRDVERMIDDFKSFFG